MAMPPYFLPRPPATLDAATEAAEELELDRIAQLDEQVLCCRRLAVPLGVQGHGRSAFA